METHTITTGQSITLHLGRRVLKSGKVTKGTARTVKVTEVSDALIKGTYKANGATVEGVWTREEVADKL